MNLKHYKRLKQKQARLLKVKQPKKRKYFAKKVAINGHQFDSQTEAWYYLFLIQHGYKENVDFKMQVPFVIFDEPKTVQSKKPAKRSYIADFVFYKKGKPVRIEDVKGYKVLSLASLKMDMTSAIYHLPVYIVRYENGLFVKELR